MNKSLPRYVQTRERVNGETAYLYAPPPDVKKAGVLKTEMLGVDRATAFLRAGELNGVLDDWRRRKHSEPLARIIKPGSVAELAKDYMASRFFKDLAPETQTSYRQHINHFIQHVGYGGKPMGDLPAATLEHLTVDKLYEELREKRGHAAANHIMACMRRVYTVGLRWRKVKWNPFEKMNLPSPPSRAVRWTEDQVRSFVAKAEAMGLRSVGLAAVLNYELAQRGIDSRLLQWSNYTGTHINLVQTKTGKALEILVTPALKNMLDATTRDASGFVVVSEVTGKPYTRNYLAKCAQRVRKAAELPEGIWLADLRRTRATELGDAGATEEEIRAVTGHEPGRVVGVYSRVTAKKAENAVKKLLEAKDS